LGNIWGKFLRDSGKILGRFRRHAPENIQGTFWEHSGNIQGTCPLGTFREQHLGNIQEKFLGDSGNIQGTFWENSWEIQATFCVHSGNIWGTFRK
jgi:hypothetical protein